MQMNCRAQQLTGGGYGGGSDGASAAPFTD